MVKSLIIADDLTGANGAGAVLKKNNIDSVCFLGSGKKGIRADASIYSTDSRGIPSEEAYKRVYYLTNKHKNPGLKLYAKRIDSTMRGNVGAEIDGMMDALGENYTAVCTPAFPDSGRTVVGGEVLVHGIPLIHSELAKDPKSRLFTSSVKDIIAGQSKYKICNLTTEDISCSDGLLSEKIDGCIDKGFRIIVCDAVTNGDLERLAQAIKINKHPIFTADPGILTAFTAKEILSPKARITSKKVLAVVGSVNVMARVQLENLWSSGVGTEKIIINTSKLLDEHSKQKEISRVVAEALAKKTDCNILSLVSDGIYPEYRIPITEDISLKINEAMGLMTCRIMDSVKEFKGLYTSGGDITVAVYRHMEAEGIRIMQEVLPLAVYGRLFGGTHNNLPIITKGGSQGAEDALTTCVSYLYHVINK